MALSFDSYFSIGNEPFDQVKWVKKPSRIIDTTGRGAPREVHSFDAVEFPDFWSQTAIDITVSRYFRKSGVPDAFGEGGAEVSLKSLISRVSDTIKTAGLEQGYFKTQKDADNFEKDLKHLLVFQKAAFNSPVWFNCGLFHKYGIAGARRELFSWDHETKSIVVNERSYERPQLSACFIQSVKPKPEDIEALAYKEMQLFKYGSGSGTNFSTLLSHSEITEPSMDLIAVLERLDEGAARVKSGGVARRAAKMVLLDIDHPDVLPFIRWKKNEERKLQRLVEQGQAGHFESEAFNSLKGQNSNNSLRISDRFIEALKNRSSWELKSPLTRETLSTISSEELWDELCEAAWECADPGVQFSDTIESWNTCKVSGAIRASNPCSEYVFLDETACNLASINLAAFYTHKDGFNFEAFRHAVRTLIVAQDILVDFAGYPSEAIARRSHEFRTLGLGYANLGGLFLRMGVPYGTNEAVAWTHLITALMQAEALQTSQSLAGELGSFEAFKLNASSYFEVLKKHQSLWEECKDNIPIAKSELSKLSNTWAGLIDRFETYGFRNAQVTVIAPTGTIALFMDCETTGIEPEYSLVRYKQLSGGGNLKFVNQALPDSLKNLGYSSAEVQKIIDHVLQYSEIESAPGLRREHLPIFDTCAPSGRAERRLNWRFQVAVVAAAQKFISGAISKTVNLPRQATPQDVSEVYLAAHKLGIKALSIYRDGSKASQPLTQAPSSS